MTSRTGVHGLHGVSIVIPAQAGVQGFQDAVRAGNCHAGAPASRLRGNVGKGQA